MDTKFGTNVSNRKLLNAAKFQGYTFYRFWVIKGKPAGAGGAGKITPPPTSQNGQIHSNNSWAVAADLFECIWLFCGVGA